MATHEYEVTVDCSCALLNRGKAGQTQWKVTIIDATRRDPESMGAPFRNIAFGLTSMTKRSCTRLHDLSDTAVIRLRDRARDLAFAKHREALHG